MKLYGTYMSPYTLRVLLVAGLRGAQLELLPPPSGGEERAEYLRLNLTGKVPFLDDDGFYLSESAVIADYIDAILPGVPLWPKDARERSHAALLSCLLDGWVTRGLTGATRDIMAGATPNPADEQLYAEGLRLVDRQRRQGDLWMHGDSVGHADAILIPLLFIAERFDSATGAGASFARYPRFAAYWEMAQNHPVVADLLPLMRKRAEEIERRKAVVLSQAMSGASIKSLA